MKKALLPLLLVSSTAFADLTLDNSVSQLNFGSIKNNSVAELHRFTELSGSVDKSGNAKISVDLSSVDTRIDIRDKRMKEHLFKVESFPKAVFTAKVDVDAVESMAIGEIQQRRLKGELDLHGKKAPLELLVRVVKGAGDALTVYTVEPTFISIADFDLGAGVDKLQELAGLKSITRAVPLTFSVVFRDQGNADEPDEGDDSPLKKILPF